MVELSSRSLVDTPEVYRKVSYYFFSYPQAMIGLSDLALSITASKTATREAITTLVKEGLIIKTDVGKAWLLSVNQKSKFLVRNKIPYNLEMIYESDIIDRIYEKYPNANAIILFGSYRWGTDNENSDIDIAVEVTGAKKLLITELGIIKKFGYRKNVKVNIHFFSKNSTDINLLTNIYNGIVLDGLLEVPCD